MNRIPTILTTGFVSLQLSAGLFAGEITGIQVTPDPACVNSAALIEVTGIDPCQQVSLQADVPNSPVQTMNNPDFPVPFQHTYTAIGTYTLNAASSHPQCIGEVTRSLTVQTCGILAEEWFEDAFELINPRITGGFGLIQPGNPFPVVIFGEKFGPTAGGVLLEGQFGAVPLTVLEWGADGKFASVMIPDGICGVPDHQATIRVISSDGWWSTPWPVNFTAKRDTMVFPRSEVEVLSCGHDSNMDCCNHQCDPTDIFFVSCGKTPNSSICGGHYNAWATIGNDSGTDQYRVDLTPGFWRIEGVDFDEFVDPGEGFAQLQPNNAFQEQEADFSINWEVTPNDSVEYDLFVHISGPCGISHNTAFSFSMLTDVIRNLKGMAIGDEMSARSLEQFENTQRQVRAAEIRRAAAEDRQVQDELERLRAGVTDDSITKAREFERLRGDAGDIKRRASNPEADRDAIRSAIDALMERLDSSGSDARD